MTSGTTALQSPGAVIFDWDNTLVDTWPVIRDALNTTLTAYGHDAWSMAECRVRVRKSLRDSFPDLFGDDWPDAADLFYHRYDEIHMEKLVPIDGIEAMLEDLSARQFYLGVVSNKRGDFLRAEAGHLGWSRFFGAIVGANDAPRDKPAPDPIIMALGPSGMPAGPNVWFVGDADIDLECAANSGCTGILLRTDAPGAGEFSCPGPAHHFASAKALCKYVDNL